MNWIGDIADIARSLGLKRVGSEYKGPCPISSCGGTDRFHIQRGTKGQDIVLHCRHGCSFADLAREMRDRGLVTDNEYDREKYRREKAEEAKIMKRFAMRVYEDALRAGHKMTLDEKLEYNNLKNYLQGVDSDPNSV